MLGYRYIGVVVFLLFPLLDDGARFSLFVRLIRLWADPSIFPKFEDVIELHQRFPCLALVCLEPLLHGRPLNVEKASLGLIIILPIMTVIQMSLILDFQVLVNRWQFDITQGCRRSFGVDLFHPVVSREAALTDGREQCADLTA